MSFPLNAIRFNCVRCAYAMRYGFAIKLPLTRHGIHGPPTSSAVPGNLGRCHLPANRVGNATCLTLAGGICHEAAELGNERSPGGDDLPSALQAA